MASLVGLTADKLDKFLTKNIGQICPVGFGKVGDASYHCAHFVGHVLRLNGRANVGLTCTVMSSAGRKFKKAGHGACIRVNELFNRVDYLAAPDDTGCLAYITMSSNLKEKPKGAGYVMGTGKKHVGIYLGGQVWHYGNTRDQVKKQTLAAFKKHYTGNTKTLFSKFPKAAKFQSLADLEGQKKTK